MYESNEQKELLDYLSDPAVRHLYIDSHIRRLIATQLRSMRESRGWSQDDVGKEANMKQNAITRLENPKYNSMTLSTLKRLAKAFDVALIVRFAPFSEFTSWITQINESRLSPLSFEEELSFQEELNDVPFIKLESTELLDTRDIDTYKLYTKDVSASTVNAIPQGAY